MGKEQSVRCQVYEMVLPKLVEFLSDGQWHSRGEIREFVRSSIAPEFLVRLGKWKSAQGGGKPSSLEMALNSGVIFCVSDFMWKANAENKSRYGKFEKRPFGEGWECRLLNAKIGRKNEKDTVSERQNEVGEDAGRPSPEA